MSRREHSQAELIRKLARAGYDQGEVTEALNWVKEHGMQSQDRFASSLIRRRSRQYGDRAIKAELSQHGISQAGNLPEIEQELQPESDRILDWFQRRYCQKLYEIANEAEGIDKEALFALKIRAFRAMSAKGFEQNNIEKAWKRFVDEFLSNR